MVGVSPNMTISSFGRSSFPTRSKPPRLMAPTRRCRIKIPGGRSSLLILAIILLIAAAISESEDLAYHDSDIVIGNLERWQSNDVDAAVCLLNGNRSLPSGSSFHYLDAQSGEVSTVPLDAMDTEISITGETMTNADIDTLIAAGDTDNMRVFKSGARTG